MKSSSSRIQQQAQQPQARVFDWVGYLDNNPDLRQNGILTKVQALNHWNKYGKREGRTFVKQIAQASSAPNDPDANTDNSVLGIKEPVKIKPYAIYFPQFHPFPENDTNYYPGMTDMTNLELYFKENPNNPENLERPDMSVYGLNSMSEYRLDNPELVNKQVALAREYGICGFAIYYYWFSGNTITNKNKIMDACYDNFFKTEYTDFKVFYTWANENWKSSVHFGKPKTIENNYSPDNISKFCADIIPYFKHTNYLKVDNKPVLGIHHPHQIPSNKLDQIYNVLNQACIDAGFAGVYLLINNCLSNSSNQDKHKTKYNNKYHSYFIRPAHKSNSSSTFIKNNKLVYDYSRYVNQNIDIKPGRVNSIYFDFNNTARMYKPNNLKRTFRLINTTDDAYNTYINKLKTVFNKYTAPHEIYNMVLINAWNEWGEKMHIEPSIESGFKLLNLIKNINN